MAEVYVEGKLLRQIWSEESSCEGLKEKTQHASQRREEAKWRKQGKSVKRNLKKLLARPASSDCYTIISPSQSLSVFSCPLFTLSGCLFLSSSPHLSLRSYLFIYLFFSYPQPTNLFCLTGGWKLIPTPIRKNKLLDGNQDKSGPRRRYQRRILIVHWALRSQESVWK